MKIAYQRYRESEPGKPTIHGGFVLIVGDDGKGVRVQVHEGHVCNVDLAPVLMPGVELLMDDNPSGEATFVQAETEEL